ncbi:MAG: HNH endonuclease [Desertimonas sp.]
MREARDRLFCAGRTEVTWVDALVDIATRSLHDLPDSRRELFRVNLYLQADATLTTTDGTVVPDAIRRHLTCDGTISPILCDGAHPVAVARTQRIVPERTRRIVEHRDHGRCANPLCLSSYGLEIHHIIHWTDGGPTDPWNLITLCSGCHRLHHQGRLTITGNADDPDGVTFTDRHGQPFHKPQPRPPDRLPNPPPHRYRRPCGHPLHRDALTGVFPQPPTTN